MIAFNHESLMMDYSRGKITFEELLRVLKGEK